MGALPDRLPGFQHVENDELRAKFDAGLGRQGPATARLAPVRDVRRDGAGRSARRSTASARTRSSRRRTRSARSHLLEGLDLLVVQDLFLTKTAAAGRRRPPRHGGLGRVRGHRHQLRATRPARARGRGAAARRGARRPGDHLRARQPDGRRTGASPRPRTSGRRSVGCRPVHAGHELPPARGARRAPVAVLRRGPPGRAVPALAAVGGPGARQPRAVRARGPRPAGRQAHDRVPDPAHDGASAGLVQHGRPERRLHVARCGAASRSTSRRRT